MSSNINLIIVGIMLISLAGLSSAYSCNETIQCNFGECKNETCMCLNGYVHYEGTVCIYKQREKLTAFLLSFFIGNIGSDWFYLAQGNSGKKICVFLDMDLIFLHLSSNLGYAAAGVFKLLTGMFFLFGSCLLCCAGLFSSFREKASSKTFGMICGGIIVALCVACSFANAIWWFVDWIRILSGGFKDGNGISLKDW